MGLQIKHIRWVLLVLIGTIWLTQSYWQHLYYNWRCDHLAAELGKKYSLVVRYKSPSEFYVSPLTPLVDVPEKGFSIESTDARYAYTALKGVRRALSQYPQELIKKHLSAVFISGKITTHGVQIGGSYIYSWIYLSALEKYEPSGYQLYLLNFHHEFSSLLLNSGGFPSERWLAVNLPDFKYLTRQIDVVHSAKPKNRHNPKDASSWYKEGFVHDYGMSSLENDFNMYAELAMAEPEKLKQLTQQYPRIKAKTNILVEFYSGLAPELGTYLKSVGLNENIASK